MRYSIILLFVLAISMTSCRKDFDTVPSSGKLEFSKTTVYLDTVFTNVGSSTYTLKVYNRSDDDITIPSVGLAKGNASKYRMMVDGMMGENGKMFKNVELLAHDSLFVFIEETAEIADANPTDMLYTDEILFDAGSNLQKVNLVTLIQDAVFLFPTRTPNGEGGFDYEGLPIDTDPPTEIYGFYLDPSELHFTNEKPYVIYGYAGVRTGDVLTIDPGARVHFHDQSGIIIGGSIHVNGLAPTTPGNLDNEVIFEGDRLEPDFSEVPGQWGTIWLTMGSINNSFEHLTIKNASVGILIEKSTDAVQIKNTQIYNSANVGILARTGNINGENIVINKAGQYALACTLGGTYDFIHCTFTNYWTGSSRQSPAVLLDNTLKTDTVTLVEDLNANFNNCIIFGPNNLELGLVKNDTKPFVYQISNCLIKFNDSSNQFANNSLYTLFLSNVSNLISNFQHQNDPKFKNTAKNNLRIGLTSSVVGKGNSAYTTLVPFDADGNPRVTSDIGAYIAQ